MPTKESNKRNLTFIEWYFAMYQSHLIKEYASQKLREILLNSEKKLIESGISIAQLLRNPPKHKWIETNCPCCHSPKSHPILYEK